MQWNILHNEDINFPQTDKKYNATPIKVPERLFIDTDKTIQKFIWEDKGTGIVKIHLNKTKD